MGRAIDAGTPVSYALMHGNKSVVGALIGGYLGGVLTKRSLGYTPLDGRRLRARAADRDGDRPGRLLPDRAAAGHGDDAAVGHDRRCRRRPRPSRAAPTATCRCIPSMLYEIGFNLVAIPILHLGPAARPGPGRPAQGLPARRRRSSGSASSSCAATRCRRWASRARNSCSSRASSCWRRTSCGRLGGGSIGCPTRRRRSHPSRSTARGAATMSDGPPPPPPRARPGQPPPGWDTRYAPPEPTGDLVAYLRANSGRYTREALDPAAGGRRSSDPRRSRPPGPPSRRRTTPRASGTGADRRPGSSPVAYFVTWLLVVVLAIIPSGGGTYSPVAAPRRDPRRRAVHPRDHRRRDRKVGRLAAARERRPRRGLLLPAAAHPVRPGGDLCLRDPEHQLTGGPAR